MAWYVWRYKLRKWLGYWVAQWLSCERCCLSARTSQDQILDLDGWSLYILYVHTLVFSEYFGFLCYDWRFKFCVYMCAIANCVQISVQVLLLWLEEDIEELNKDWLPWWEVVHKMSCNCDDVGFYSLCVSQPATAVIQLSFFIVRLITSS